MKKTPKKRKSFFKHKKRLGFMTPHKYHCRRKCATWNELRLFLAELAQNQKDYQSISTKATAISKKAMALNENLPIQFDKPQIKSRISTLITKVRLLDLYIHLD
jgi:hypothetical protein